MSRERTPARTPWWLLLLRLVIAALLILALAGPVLNPAPRLGGSGPLLLVVDNGWAAAKHWDQRIAVARDLLQQAEREGREVLLLETAPSRRWPRRTLQPAERPGRARGAAGLAAAPWPVDRAAAREALGRRPGLEQAPAASGSATASPWAPRARRDGRAAGRDAAAARAAAGPRRRRRRPARSAAAPGRARGCSLEAEVAAVPRRPRGPRGRGHRARAARPLARVPVTVGGGDAGVPRPRSRCRPTCATGSPGSSWRRRRASPARSCSTSAGAGARSGWSAPAAQRRRPAAAGRALLHRARAAALRRGARGPDRRAAGAAAVAAGHGRRRPASTPRSAARLDAWIEAGGVLLRFAGPQARRQRRRPGPGPLRAGDRMLGGALSWSEPLPLAPFPPDSPFAGLPVTEEVRVSRQVLAEPGPDLAGATLASLADGTPLVTGARRGKGWLILVHTTANTAWTTLPLSGLFVQMLRARPGPGAGRRRRRARAAGAQPAARRASAAWSSRRAPWPRPAARRASPRAMPGPRHPPGLYAPVGLRGRRRPSERGRPLGAQPAARRARAAAAWRAAPPAARPSPMPAPPSATSRRR